MDPHHDPSGDFLIESETNLQAESSTIAGMGPKSLTPSLDLVMLLTPVAGNPAGIAPFLLSVESQVEPPFGVMLVYEQGDEAALAVATEFARSRPWMDLVPNAASPGRAGALQTGLRAIGHGPVVVMSIDGTDNPSDIGRMRRLYAEGHPIVAASRDMRGGHRRGGSRLSHRMSRLANRLIRSVGRMPLQDPTNSYRLYDAALVNELGIDSRHDVDIPVELAAKALSRGLPIIEIPTTTNALVPRSGILTRVTGPLRWWRWCRQSRRHAAAPALTQLGADRAEEMSPHSSDSGVWPSVD